MTYVCRETFEAAIQQELDRNSYDPDNERLARYRAGLMGAVRILHEITEADVAPKHQGQTPCDTICNPQSAPACTQECIDACDIVNPAFKSEKDSEMDPVSAAEILADFASGGLDYKKQPHVLVALRMAHRALINSIPYVLTKEQIRDRILTLGPDKFQPLYIQLRDNEHKNAPRWRDCYNVNSLVGGVPSDSDYGKIFVLWSALPSEDQMNAVEWEDMEK